MRTERKLFISKNVLVKFDSTFNVFVRKPGKKNKNDYVELIKISSSDDTITIDQSVADEYGIKIVINS